MKKELSVVSEIKALSTEFVRHFLLSDGAHRAAYQVSSTQPYFHMWGYSNKGERVDIANSLAGFSKQEDTYSYLGFSVDLTAIRKIGVIRNVSLKLNASKLNNCGIFDLESDHVTVGKRLGEISKTVKETIDITSIFESGQSWIKEFAIKSLSEDLLSLATDAESIISTLEIDYIPAEELIRGQEYFENEVGESITCNINILSGIPFVNVSLLNLGGERFPLSLSLHFDAIRNGFIQGLDTGLGNKWYTNFHQYCYKEEKNYVYIDSNSLKHIFIPAINSDTLWVDSQGTGLLLETTTYGIMIYDETGNKFFFDGQGRLTTISIQQTEDENFTNTISYTSTSGAKISKIVDGMGRVARFDYTTDGVFILLDEAFKIKLTINKNLLEVTKIDDAGGSSVSHFIYNESNEITQIVSATDDKVNLQYSNGIIESVCNSKTMLKHNFNYWGHCSKIISSNNIEWLYSYNSDFEFTSCTELIRDIKLEHKAEKSAIFFDRDECVQYAGELSPKVSNTFLFSLHARDTGDSTIHFPASYKGCTHSSYIQKVDSASYNKFAIFSAEIININISNSEPASGPSLLVELVANNGNEVLCSIPFYKSPSYQFGATAFRLKNYNKNDDEKSELKVRLTAFEVGGYTLTNIRITPATHGVNAVCTNIDTGSPIGFYQDESQNKPIYFITPNSEIQMGDNTYSYKLYTADYLANERNLYKSNGGSWNMWVDNKRKLIANVKDPVVIIAGKKLKLNLDQVIKPRFGTISVDNETLTADWQSHQADDQIPYDGTKSYVRHSIVSYTRDKSTPNYTQDIYYDKFGRELIAKDDKKTSENTYTQEGYLSATKLMKTDSPSSYIYESWAYENNYLTHTYDYLGDTVADTMMWYGPEMGTIRGVKAPNGEQTFYYYYDFGEKLKKIESDNRKSYNQIIYENGKLTELYHDDIYYKFTYCGPRISSISIGDVVYATIDYKFNVTKYFNNIVTTNYGNGMSIKRVYDKYNRLNEVHCNDQYAYYIYSDDSNMGHFESYPNSPFLSLSSESKLYKTIDNFCDSVILYDYNDYGNLSNIQEKINNETALDAGYTYDDRLRLSKVEYDLFSQEASIRVSYSYFTGNNAIQNEVQSVKVQTENTELEYKIEKDDLDRLEYEKIINLKTNTGINKRYTYALRNMMPLQGVTLGPTNYVSSESFSIPNSRATVASSIDYTYDISRNISSVTHNGKKTEYFYDSLNRLIRENNPFLNKTTMYEYDDSGNITNKTEWDYTTAYKPTKLINEDQYIYSDSFKDRLERIERTGLGGTLRFVYDECGNPTTYRGRSMGWTRGRLLAYVNQGDLLERKYIYFKYDGSGIRRQKNIQRAPNTYEETYDYIYANGQLIGERKVRSYSAIQKIYEYRKYFYNQNGIFGMQLNDKTYFYLKNLFGDIIAILDADTNTLVAFYEYDAWGNHKVYDADGNEATNENFIGNINPFRYRGYYYDTDVKMYYLQTRWYDPEIGRFINLDMMSYADPETINGLNLYAYCLNNPVMGYDPDGTINWNVIGWIGVGLIAVASIAAIGVVAAGVVATGSLLAGVLVGAGSGALISMTAEIISEGGNNPWSIVKAGAKGGAVGAFSGLTSWVGGKIVENIGLRFGYAMSNAIHLGSGRTFGNILGRSLVMNFIKGAAEVTAGLIGAIIGNEIGYELLGDTQESDEIISGGFMSEAPLWLIRFLRWLGV